MFKIFRNDDFYEIPFRPPYEYISGGSYLLASAFSFYASSVMTLPQAPGQIIGVLSGFYGAYKMYQGYKLHTSIINLYSGQLNFIDEKDAVKKFDEAIKEKSFWLGTGFTWNNKQVAKMHYIRNKGIDNLIDNRKQKNEYKNSHWIHALGKEAHEDVKPLLKILNGMMVVVGTTGAGKTRLYDILISQAIQRKEAVVLIDPKGDKDIAFLMKRATIRENIADKYLYFHPSKPNESVRLDVLKNWNRKTEIASRIKAILPMGKGADAFSEYAWQVINDIVGAELLIDEKPTLFKIKTYVSGGVQNLAFRAVKFYCEKHIPKEKIASYVKSNGGDKGKKSELDTYIELYQNYLSNDENSEVNGIIDLAKHDKDHLSKMIPILTPLLAKLTDGPLKDLLSPDASNPDDHRPLADNKKIVAESMVLYMALDSLSDSTIGSAIGSMELADLVAVAGDRYNFVKEEDYKPVNLYIDEAAEIINDSLIQLMNKGRGALFRVTLATQTISDLTVRLGSKEKMNQVLGNANSTIILRIKDDETAKYMADGIAKIIIPSLQTNTSTKSDANLIDARTLNYSESKKETEVYILPSDLLKKLPDLHYFALISGSEFPIKGELPIISIDE